MRAAALVSLLFFLSCSFASSQEPPSPKHIQREIDQKGPKETARQLYADKAAWAALTKNVAAGRPSWIDLAVLLRGVSDGGASSELQDAMFAALAVNPKHVLVAAGRALSVKTLCSGRSDPLATGNKAMAEIDRIQAAVGRVSDQHIARQQTECLAALEEARANTKRFFRN